MCTKQILKSHDDSAAFKATLWSTEATGQMMAAALSLLGSSGA